MNRRNAANSAPRRRRAEVCELVRHCNARLPEIVTTLRRLVELESPTTDKTAVDRLAAFVAQELEARGGRVRLHRQRAVGDHLQADFAGQGRPLLLLGHLDTVWDIGTLKRMPVREARGRLYGPGTLDMKSGIALMLHALDTLRDRDCRRAVRVLLVSDEETGSASSRTITEDLARNSCAVLVLEPAAGLHGALKTARKGVGEFHIKVTGRAAHSGLDFEKGDSAVLELARQLLAVEEFVDLERGVTVNPGVIKGGTRVNVVAAEAEADVDARVARLSDWQRLEKRFRALKPFNQQCRVEVTGGIDRPPMERRTSAALYAQARALARELGFELQEAAVGGGSDGNFTAAQGAPTLDGLGGLGEGAHAANEFVVLGELPRRAALLVRLIENLQLSD